MNSDIIIPLIGYGITFFSYIIYAFIKFTKLENEVKHLILEMEDIKEMKQMVYKIYAQNEIILQIKSSSCELGHNHNCN